MTTPPTPLEYMTGLSVEDKSRVFCALLKELITLNGGTGLISVTAPDGEYLGYHVPPKAAEAIFKEYGPKFTAEHWAAIDAPSADDDSALATEDAKAAVIAHLTKRRSAEPALSGS
jgi:hypothetical protein